MVTERDEPVAHKYKYAICSYAVEKLIRKRKAKGDALEYFVALRSSERDTQAADS